MFKNYSQKQFLKIDLTNGVAKSCISSTAFSLKHSKKLWICGRNIPFSQKLVCIGIYSAVSGYPFKTQCTISVLGSDVIYSEGAVADLLATLMQLCGAQTTIILAGELRNGNRYQIQYVVHWPIIQMHRQ